MMIDKEEVKLLFDRLWPIHRSITGDGNRKTLEILSEIVPIEIHEVSSGKKLNGGWVVPKEWRVNHAYLIGPSGSKILDIKDNLLHLLNYSKEYSGKLSLEELDKHLFSRSDLPEAIPYVTSYYKERWGFCLPHNLRLSLPKGDYQVEIDTEMFDGSLTFGEFIIPGKTKKEIFFSSFFCHPMMANNELAGPIVQTLIAREIMKKGKPYYTYRFVWHPETIGSITYLNIRGKHLIKSVVAGFGFCCVGDGKKLTYKRSRRHDTLADRIAEFTMKDFSGEKEIRSFKPFDGDERQYCSPGFNLPYGCFMHTPPGEYPEYHSSLDNIDLIDFPAVINFISFILNCCENIEFNQTYCRIDPYVEPKLDKFNLWPTLGVGAAGGYEDLNYALLWFLNYADGRDLLDIAKLSGQPLGLLAKVAKICEQCGLVKCT